jgi:cell division protein FtsL
LGAAILSKLLAACYPVLRSICEKMTQDDFIFDEAIAVRPRPDTSAWTIPLLCFGIATIACCVLLPATNENRQLTNETRHLQADLDQLKHQIAVNDQFLKSVADDPTLLERLAQRQMKMVHSGESVLNLKGDEGRPQMSPFLLTNLPPPAVATATPPGTGTLDKLADEPRLRLYAMGGALLLVAVALVLGVS